mmetsp:Transcript_10344/g.10419  ORF Transcript_10344/g.10419 Transcript_10344/m.10419 type:complete len:308 (+) Transcript_10344:51-974(+)
MSNSSVPKGVVVNADGDWIIPGTRRPDGTYRKEKKVKPGYIPQDEMVAFETTANKKQKGIGIPGLASPPTTANISSSAARNLRKRENKKKAKAELSASEIVPEKTSLDNTEESNVLKETKDPAKRLKNLRKKLRDIHEFKQKVGNGEMNPTPEQIEKMRRQGEIEIEITELEKIVKSEDTENTSYKPSTLKEDHNKPEKHVFQFASKVSDMEKDLIVPPANTSSVCDISDINMNTLSIASTSLTQESERSETEKKIRTLKKKLRQITDIESKLVSGKGTSVATPEQLEKIQKKSSLLEEIDCLERKR